MRRPDELLLKVRRVGSRGNAQRTLHPPDRSNAGSAIGFPAADQEAMRIVFEDGTSQECSPTDRREIIAEAGFHPVQGIPKRLKRVSDNPPTWANLVVVRCSVIVPDHYLMTSAGLKRVARVER
jgi:hypothetical protein